VLVSPPDHAGNPSAKLGGYRRHVADMMAFLSQQRLRRKGIGRKRSVPVIIIAKPKPGVLRGAINKKFLQVGIASRKWEKKLLSSRQQGWLYSLTELTEGNVA